MPKIRNVVFLDDMGIYRKFAMILRPGLAVALLFPLLSCAQILQGLLV